MRSCIQLRIFRSARVRIATVIRTVTITMVILTTAAPAKTRISIRYFSPPEPTFSTVTVANLPYGTPATGPGVPARREARASRNDAGQDDVPAGILPSIVTGTLAPPAREQR